MVLDPKKISVKVGEHELHFETGRIARQAGGAVVVTQGETVVFASACRDARPSEEIDFLPLRVDYQEKFSSAGKTLGGFIKREGRPTERETLVCRLIDRPLRPMFEEGYYHETQLISYVWSYDTDHQPDVLAICAASAALVISDIPLIKPIGAVRVGLVGDRFVVNPSKAQMAESKLDLVMAGTDDAILMIEGYCDFLPEEKLIEAMAIGHEAIRAICEMLSKWQAELGQPKKRDTLRKLPTGIMQAIEKADGGELEKALRIVKKVEREMAQAAAKERVTAALFSGENDPYTPVDFGIAYKNFSAQVMRRMVLKDQVRCDGRKTDEVRPIWIETACLPRVHGSALFTRGETQALAVCTLGGSGMAQRFEDLHEEGSRHFYLQYTFPPFSVGEVGRMGAPGRREVGHGKLAERALEPTLPDREGFPYVVRLESNITESNGSSSMASVCGGSLAMMDAGIPVKRPVAGIAMGLILESDGIAILSDILGVEDALGDMDFKVTGDESGVTAFQMDIKIEGITPKIMAQALAQAKQGRVHILKKMLEACPAPRAEMSSHAPRIETVRVKPSKIATIIGPGGKQIRAIIEETGVQIDINDDGLVSIAATDAKGMERAKKIIADLTAEIEVGRVYHGKVTSVVPFGAFVEVIPGKEGLCHISELDTSRVEDINAFIKEGEFIDVKVLDINERGQLKLSRKATLKGA
jgi:polyribonucleotide nucleotidyltransferase